MDDFGFGPDPDFDAEYEADRAVLDEIERDLGQSYIAERVTPAKNNKPFDPLRGQSFIDRHDEEKEVELIDYNEEDILNELNANKPLKRSRKRKRSINNDGMDENGEDILDLSVIPNAKRIRTNNYTSSISTAINTEMKDINDNIDDEDEFNDELEMYLHGRPSLNDTSIPITNDMDGEQLYIYYDTENQYAQNMKNCMKKTKKNLHSLSMTSKHEQSIDELLDELQNERIAAEIRALNEDFLDLRHNDKNIPSYLKEKESDNIQTELWVDKYAPKLITDLCSSEKINREVTEWVKEWDYIVFGHKYSRFKHANNNKFVGNKINKNTFNINTKSKTKTKNVYSIRNNLPVFGRFSNNNNNNRNIRNDHQLTSNNKKKRPEISVLLFCGAPGTGKSTLAHIVANHCGYRPFEINASDDRSGKKLKEVIVNAATMKPMFGDLRPPLIIMDEIDGSQTGDGDSKSAVDIILNIVKDAQNYYAQKNKNKDSQKRKNNIKIVNRPIICICNNEYSRALRPLRDICKIYKFKPISTRTLCKRLLEICRKEYVHTDLKTLSYLANITNNDIRSCLHTLQFFKERSGGGKRLSTRLNVDTLSNIPIGRKDKTQNIFDVWNRILKRKNADKQNKDGAKWKEICTMIYGMSNDNKIINGIIENYLSLGYTDPVGDITLNTSKWIMYHDILQSVIKHKQQFVLMGYIPYVIIGIHENVATDTFQKLKYPSNQYRIDMKYKENQNIIQNFLHCEDDLSKNDKDITDVNKYSILLARYFDINSCVLELVPLLPFIISTAHRWNNNDFNGNAENDQYNRPKFGGHQVSNKRVFVSIINTMIQCGLNYIKPDKSSNYLQLTPPIDKLSKYSFINKQYKEAAQCHYMNQYVKQRIAHQIVLEVMRRNEAGFNKYQKKGDIQQDDNKDNLDEDGEDDDKSMSDQQIRTMTPFMSNRVNKKSSSRLKGRLLTPGGGGQFGKQKPSNLMTQQSQSQTETPAKFRNFITAHNKKTKIEKFQYPIQYKFVEGYTNAVKRKSFIRDWI